MKLESHVTSLELSKRLKELGVKQTSSFYYLKWKKSPLEMNLGYKDVILSNNNSFFIDDNYEYCSAFLASELGEMLPSEYLKFTFRDDTGFYLTNVVPISKWQEMFPCKTEADARAKMLIHLIEKGIVNV